MSAFEEALLTRLAAVAEEIIADPYAAEAVRNAAGDLVLETNLDRRMQHMIKLVIALETAQDNAKAQAERARAALLIALTESGAYGVETEHHRVDVVNGAPSVVITDPLLLGDRFWTNPKPQPDKDAIRRALRGGASICGAMLTNGAPYVRIVARKA